MPDVTAEATLHKVATVVTEKWTVKVTTPCPLFPKDTLTLTFKFTVKNGAVTGGGVYCYDKLDSHYRKKIGQNWKTLNATDDTTWPVAVIKNNPDAVIKRGRLVTRRNTKVIKLAKSMNFTIGAALAAKRQEKGHS